MPSANPLELTTDQSKQFLNQLVEFGDPLPHVILTGGDPLNRKDIYELIDHARGNGLEVSITTAATSQLTNDAICDQISFRTSNQPTAASTGKPLVGR